MGPRAGLDRCGKSRPHRDSIPGPPSPWRVAVPTEPTRPTHNSCNHTQNLPLLNVPVNMESRSESILFTVP